MLLSEIYYMRLFLSGFIALCLTLQLASCELVNPEEAIPAYIQIDTIQFVNNSAARGTAQQKIVEAWVTVDDDFLGTYDLPATIPVLKSGAANVIVRPGIKDNGIGSLSEIYTFFRPFETSVTLSPTETAILQPSTSYISDINFAFVEDFESGVNWFTDDLDGDSVTVIQTTTEDVFEGNQSGVIRLTSANPIVEVATDFGRQFRDLQTKGVEVYLEMHYKTDVELAIGAIGHQEGVFTPEEKIYEPILFPKSDWNKVYLNLSQAVFTLQSVGFQITFLAGLDPGQESGDIYIDNIKLIHF
ncbi:MAG: hypothetical protein AAGI23_04185 [Bacteroidota bacterium]